MEAATKHRAIERERERERSTFNKTKQRE